MAEVAVVKAAGLVAAILAVAILAGLRGMASRLTQEEGFPHRTCVEVINGTGVPIPTETPTGTTILTTAITTTTTATIPMHKLRHPNRRLLSKPILPCSRS